MDQPAPGAPPRSLGIFCNRTLNLRSVGAIGYDMDYTLIHYHIEEWERTAYEFMRDALASRGWPVEKLSFEPASVIRGLVIDKKLGNIVKANRFGYVQRAAHGRRTLEHAEQRQAYSRTMIDLAEGRWQFLNTFFSLSEGCLYTQLVDMLDSGGLRGVLGYEDLYERVRDLLDEAHTEGEVKSRIIAQPERYVSLDEKIPLTLLDQRMAGKRLLLITNSEWGYTKAMMSYAFDRFLPGGVSWRDLFDIVVVGARKPVFFLERQPIFKVDEETGLLRPTKRGLLEGNGTYLGGHAALIQDGIGLDGASILYVGDHIYSDVHVSKSVQRWRTAVIVREIEAEIRALEGFADGQSELDQLMARKVELEVEAARRRMDALRRRLQGSTGAGISSSTAAAVTDGEGGDLKERMAALDARISPLARAAGQLSNPTWGLCMRAGNDKSHFARQIERHADVYTSRVSNFLYATPFAYLRSERGSLPHDLDEDRWSTSTSE